MKKAGGVEASSRNGRKSPKCARDGGKKGAEGGGRACHEKTLQKEKTYLSKPVKKIRS